MFRDLKESSDPQPAAIPVAQKQMMIADSPESKQSINFYGLEARGDEFRILRESLSMAKKNLIKSAYKIRKYEIAHRDYKLKLGPEKEKNQKLQQNLEELENICKEIQLYMPGQESSHGTLKQLAQRIHKVMSSNKVISPTIPFKELTMDEKKRYGLKI